MQTDLDDAQKATESVYDAASQVRFNTQISAPQRSLLSDNPYYSPPHSGTAFWSMPICSIIGFVLIFKVIQRSRDTLSCVLTSFMLLLVPIWLGGLSAVRALDVVLELFMNSSREPTWSEILWAFDSVLYPLTFTMWCTLPGLLLLAGGLYYRATRTSASA